MAKYICKVCGYIFEGDIDELDENWTCPGCHASKQLFEKVKPKQREETVFLDIEDTNPAIVRDETKCVKCGNCKSVCRFKQGVYGFYDIQKCKCKTVCVDCGQCSLACPTGAIGIKLHYPQLEQIIQQKNKVIVFQIAPSARVSLAEEFGLPEGTICTGKMICALRKLGADFVFDTTFGADLTVMEEANELVTRLKQKKNLPLMTSCCPSWVKFVEIFYPEKIKYLSSCLSPILMQGAMIKSYWAKAKKIAKKQIVSVAITPCTAKKAEILRTGTVDFVIPIRELGQWLKQKGIRFDELEESSFDSMMGTGSGGGVIFGTSGGVAEAVLRTATFMLTKKNPKNLEFENVRSLEGFVEANIKLGNRNLHVCVVSGLANARKMLENIQNYDFVEVMACLGGCMAGGGQPKNIRNVFEKVRKMRSESLYQLDKNSAVRCCHENPDIINLYQNYLHAFGNPLLHTSFTDRSDILGKNRANHA